MNRQIDYRTDFYSLGVVFYEMLTGEAPFRSDDPMELIHAHIAKQPVLPSKVNSRVPSAVADIVMKLLAKNAEERYQSAEGLRSDLEFCRDQLRSGRKIEHFTPGNNDVLDRFQLPQKLYGRGQEIDRGRAIWCWSVDTPASARPCSSMKSESRLPSKMDIL
jgi:serine/threonine protein kinase